MQLAVQFAMFVTAETRSQQGTRFGYTFRSKVTPVPAPTIYHPRQWGAHYKCIPVVQVQPLCLVYQSSESNMSVILSISLSVFSKLFYKFLYFIILCCLYIRYYVLRYLHRKKLTLTENNCKNWFLLDSDILEKWKIHIICFDFFNKMMWKKTNSMGINLF